MSNKHVYSRCVPARSGMPHVQWHALKKPVSDAVSIATPSTAVGVPMCDDDGQKANGNAATRQRETPGGDSCILCWDRDDLYPGYLPWAGVRPWWQLWPCVEIVHVRKVSYQLYRTPPRKNITHYNNYCFFVARWTPLGQIFS